MNTEGVLVNLLRQGGTTLPDHIRPLLRRRPGDLNEAETETVRRLAKDAMRGFFRAAASGAEFVPASRIEERFGRTLARNYPEAGPAFLRMATTYWTMKLVLSDDWESQGELAYQLIADLESDLGALFFPTPGPFSVDPSQRAADQRSFLEEFAPEIDIEDFINNNPILQRDRKSQASGCLLVPLMIPAALLDIMLR